MASASRDPHLTADELDALFDRDLFAGVFPASTATSWFSAVLKRIVFDEDTVCVNVFGLWWRRISGPR